MPFRKKPRIISILSILLSSMVFTSCNTYIIQQPLVPGYYSINKNMYTVSVSMYTVSLIVDKIALYDDYSLEIFCTWKTTLAQGQYGTLFKGSDSNNRSMYIVDDSGFRYDHIFTTGVAYDNHTFQGTDSADGTFVFPPIRIGSTGITFFDDNQNGKITILFR